MSALFRLEHVGRPSPHGQFGVLFHLHADGSEVPFAVTLERAYFADGQGWTKIPLGLHRCSRSRYHRGGYDTYEIHVVGHSRLLFHMLNRASESDGCIGVAESFGTLYADPAILDSRHGFAELMERAGGRSEFFLEVA